MTRSTEVQIKSTSPELHIFIAYKLVPPPQNQNPPSSKGWTLILGKPGWGKWRDPIATLAGWNKEGFSNVFHSGDQIVIRDFTSKAKILFIYCPF